MIATGVSASKERKGNNKKIRNTFLEFVTIYIIFLLLIMIVPCLAIAIPHSQEKLIHKFILEMKDKHGFNQKNLENLFKEVKFHAQVVHSLNHPLEKEKWYTYRLLFVNETLIKNGVKFWEENSKELLKAEHEYGVPASIVVATLGVETKYGKRLGSYRVIDSLSSIAFSNSSRARFFKRELEEFLLLTREQHLDPLKIKGSYAGAIGQPQFLPSSYRRYAVNFSKSGKIDLISNETDVIGSIANYYHGHGWKKDSDIAAEIVIHQPKVIKAGCLESGLISIHHLKQCGLLLGSKTTAEKILFIALDVKDGKEYWLGFHNFSVIKRYNASNHYAMAVFELSREIMKLRNVPHHG